MAGGSALLWALLQREANPDGRVISIDITDEINQARDFPLSKERIEFVVGSSVDPLIFQAVKDQVKDSRVFIILDSNHEKSHVLNELRLYSQLAKVGDYILVQDTNVNGHPVAPDFGSGPMEAVQAFLAENDSFVVDLSRERLLLTMHPNGYLKRVK